MRKWLKRLGILVLVLVVLAVIGSIIGIASVDSRINKTYTVAAEALNVTVPSDQTAIDEGKRIMTFRDCFACHGADLGGSSILDQDMFGKLYGPNLTMGGIGKDFSDADYVRAIRHGLDKNGKPLVGMPADQFASMSNEDLGRIIAYIRSAPPVDKTTPQRVLTPFTKVLIALGALGTLPAETIDHTGKQVQAPQPGVSVDYGKYLSSTCQGCHKPDYSGGKVAFGPPDAPPAPNLTPAGNLAKWSDQDFITAMRTGKTPEGRQLNEFMPWKSIASMTDDELKAVFVYLKSLPAKTAAQ
jgi:mono/diheme cytochrome c family protein